MRNRSAQWASRHARSILFLLVVLVGAGIFAGLRLPVSLFPRVNFPRVRVDLEAGERPAERMVVEITRPVEQELRAIPGVRSVQSTTSRGSAQVLISFDWGADIATAMLEAQARVNKILPELPAGASFDVRRMDPTFFPVICYSVTSSRHSLTELHDLAQLKLAPQLSVIPGVASVIVTGGAIEEYRVTLDPAHLRAHGVAVTDVSTALNSANVLSAAGHVEDRGKLYLVVTDARFKNVSDVGQTIISVAGNASVRLADIAQIASMPAPQFTRATADGRDAVLFDVYQQPGSNTVNIARQIRQTIQDLQKDLPPDVTIANWYDQSDLIVQSAASVRDAVVIGVVLAAIVLFLFLRDWKITLVAAIAVPLVLAVTALILYALDQSFNIMTLGGMAAAVGLIIDDAIVICEHIARRLTASRQSGDPNQPASAVVLDAADEFGKPLAGSSLSTIVIHIPPAFMIGVAGTFFASLSLSMAASLSVSFLIAWLAIPVIAAKLIGSGSGKTAVASNEREPLLSRAYSSFMRHLLPFAWLVILLMVPLLGLGYFGYTHAETGFLPSIDEGGFVIDYRAAPGASVTETDRLCKQLEAILHQIPEVDRYSRRTGYNFGAGELSESNTGDFFVRLKPFPRRPIDDIQKDVESRVAKDVPGFDIETAQLMEDLIGDLTGRPEPVVVNVYSEDPAVLAAMCDKIKAALDKIDGIKESRSGIVPAGDALDIEVDRNRAALEGVDPQIVSKALTDLLAGSSATQIDRGNKIVDVRVAIPLSMRKSVKDVGELQLRAPDGHLFPLNHVANISSINGQPEITREDLRRMASVTARSDRDLGSTIRDVQAALDQPGFIPPNVSYKLGGLYEQQQIAFNGLLKVIIAAGAAVFFLLLFLYESFRVACAILFTTLLTIAVVLAGLAATGTQLNIASLMGLVMIVGNVTEVAIFYYSELNESPEARLSDRLIAAGVHRFRAIIMTTLAAILALLPLAIARDPGSAMLQPLAMSIIIGLIAQIPLVMFVLPALLTTLKPRLPARASVSA